MRDNLTEYQKQSLYGKYKPAEEEPKKLKSSSPVKVKTRRSVEEIRDQKELDKQFDYL